MTASAPLPPNEPREFPAYRLREFWPMMLLGWLIGSALVLVVRLLGGQLLSDPCRGHTLVALATPLLLGPGGLAFTALSWRHPPRAAMGLGLMVASFLPGLLLGAFDIGKLRTEGCAGGYVVLAEPGGRSLSSITLKQGETRQLTGRIGGYSVHNNPEPFTLRSASTNAGIVLTTPKTQVVAGETFPVTIKVAAGTPLNTYTAGMEARQTHNGQTYAANGVMEVNVRP